MHLVSGLYLHVPFCQHLCNYCDFYKKRFDPTHDSFKDYHQFLEKSLLRHDQLLAEHHYSWTDLTSIYLGGGTPSLWGIEGAEFFGDKIIPSSVLKTCEFTMEVDPGTWTAEMLEAWKKLGLNRISVGTQSLNPQFLKIFDRIHSLEDSLEFLNFLKENNWNYSLDFLLGAPFSQEKKREIERELELLLEYAPKHISLYILNARSKYPLSKNLPEDDYTREEYLRVCNFLKTKGFHHYEVSNFALPGFESQHNLKYWRGESVAALGPSATGYLKLGENQAVRYKWKISRAEVEVESLGPEELKLEKIYLGLRTSQGFSFSDEFNPLIQKWEDRNYARRVEGVVKLTSLGWVILDSLMGDLFSWEAQVLKRN